MLPRHLAEYREVDWIDVPTPGDFGTDQHRYVDLKRRSAWTRARWQWALDHGLEPRSLP